MAIMTANIVIAPTLAYKIFLPITCQKNPRNPLFIDSRAKKEIVPINTINAARIFEPADIGILMCEYFSYVLVSKENY